MTDWIRIRQNKIIGSEKGDTSSPTLQELDGKISILQNSIESIKELFLHVIEKVNHVNQENEFLRNMLIQQNSGIATDFCVRQANLQFKSTNNVSYPIKEESSFQLENQLPYLNQTAMHLNDQLVSFCLYVFYILIICSIRHKGMQQEVVMIIIITITSIWLWPHPHFKYV